MGDASDGEDNPPSSGTAISKAPGTAGPKESEELRILKWIIPFIPGVNTAIYAVMAVLTTIFVVSQVAQALKGEPSGLPIPRDVDDHVDWAFEISSFVLALGLLVAGTTRGWKTVGKAAGNMVLAFISLSLPTLSDISAKQKKFEFAVFADILAAAIAFATIRFGFPTDILPDYNLLDPISRSLDVAAIAMSLSSLGADIASLMRGN